MAYVDNLTVDSKSTYFVDLSFRNNQGTWTLDTGVRTTSFTLGRVTKVVDNDTETTLTQVFAEADLIAGTFYYDHSAKEIKILDGNFCTNEGMIIEFTHYLGLEDAYEPTDIVGYTGEVIYWEPLLANVGTLPTNDASTDQGFLPSITGTLALNNASHFFDATLRESTIFNGTINIYHKVGDLTEDNVKLVFSGKMKDASASGTQINIAYFSPVNLLDGTFSYGKDTSGKQTFQFSDYSDLDPQFENANMRVVYGLMEGVRGVGIEYETVTSTNPILSTNKKYAICKHFGGINDSSVGFTITNIVSSNTVTTGNDDRVTYVIDVNSVDGLNQFDTVFKQSAGLFDRGWIIRSISGLRITMDLVLSTSDAGNRTWSVSDSLYRHRIAGCRFFNKEKKANVEFHMDFPPTLNTSTQMMEIEVRTGKTEPGGVGVTDYEDIIAPNTEFDDPNNYLFYFKVYGEKETVQASGSTFSTNTDDFGVTSRWYEVLYSYLRNEVGLTEDQIDVDQLIALRDGDTSDDEHNVGFTVPEGMLDQPQSHRTILGPMMSSVIGLIGSKSDSKIYIDRVRSLGSHDHLITEDDIIEGSYSMVSPNIDTINRIGLRGTYTDWRSEVYGSNPRFINTYSEDLNLKALSQVDKTGRYDTIVEALNIPNARLRRLYYNGLSNYQITIKCGLDFFTVEIGEVVRLQRPSLPGFEFVFGSDNTRDFRVIKVSRERSQVTIVLQDAVGVSRFGGSF